MSSAPTATPPKSKLKSLGVRLVSGLALIAICGLPIYYGGWMFGILVTVFGLRMMWEWTRMTDKGFSVLSVALQFVGLILALSLGYQGYWNWALIIAGATAGLSSIEKSRRGAPLWAGFGSLYIILPCLAIIWIRGDIAGITSTGFAKIIFIGLVVIAADSWAYLGGSLLKGPKLAPKISPNKTWSGFLSGLIFGVFAGVICSWIIGFNPFYAMLLAIPVVLFSVLGDLLESAIKRHLDVKDAGGLLPGHGGLLDRVDSLMLAVFVAAIVLLIWPGVWPNVDIV
jgi:phosphatidate cytidylyltransferase